MKRYTVTLFFHFSAILMLCGLASGASAQELIFPRLEAEDLNGKAVEIPKDLPGDPTLILVAFVRKQQAEIDEWIKALELKAQAPAVEWIELPYVGSKARPFKKIIDNGMRSGITATEARARTITVYQEHKILLDALKLQDMDQIYVIVAERGGKVRALVKGTPDPSKKHSIVTALSGN